MILSRAVLIATAIVASYVVLSGVASAIMVGFWEAGWSRWPDLPARARAGRLASMRLLPSAVLAAVTAFVVFPLFLAAEPPHAFEPVGPALIIGGLIGAGLAARSLLIAARLLVTTSRLKRLWLRGAEPLTSTGSPIGAYQIESAEPIVALVGIWRPAFVAARVVVEACTEHEIASMMRHERTHLLARDNLKRLLMECVPDVLSLTPYHRAMFSAWQDAAEDAADDAATLGEPRARLDLAALLLKVASLAPLVRLGHTASSRFLDVGGLERRVRRLVADDSPSRTQTSDRLFVAVLIGMALLVGTLLFSSTARRVVHNAVETVVAAGAPGR